MMIVLGGLFAAMVLQTCFAYRQIKAVYAKVAQVRRCHTSGYLAMGNAKSRLPVGRGAAVILVLDETDTVADYYEMRGATVFARFKRRQELTGLTVEELAERLRGRSTLAALQKALAGIETQRPDRGDEEVALA